MLVIAKAVLKCSQEFHSDVTVTSYSLEVILWGTQMIQHLYKTATATCAGWYMHTW